VATNREFRISELVIGIGIGFLAGLLWAPRSGEDARKELRRRSREGLDYLNQQAERLRQGADKIAALTKEWIGRHGEAAQAETELQKAYEDKNPEL
jgi:gas vesicle protein